MHSGREKRTSSTVTASRRCKSEMDILRNTVEELRKERYSPTDTQGLSDTSPQWVYIHHRWKASSGKINNSKVNHNKAGMRTARYRMNFGTPSQKSKVHPRNKAPA